MGPEPVILRMASVGPAELMIVLVIALLIFGADRLGDLGGALGKGIREFKDATREEEAKAKQAEAEAARAQVAKGEGAEVQQADVQQAEVTESEVGEARVEQT